MDHSDIEHMAQGYPPSHIGKDHEEVVIELAEHVMSLQQQLNATVADQKRYEFLAQFFDVDMWDADDYHCVRGLSFNEPKFDRITIGLPYDMSLEDAIDEHLKRADAAKDGV